MRKVNIIEIIVVFISIISLFISYKAIKISDNSYKFEKIKFVEDRIKDSKKIVNEVYDKLTQENISFYNLMLNLNSGTKIEDINNLRKFADELENVGQLYCDGFIRESDIRFVFKRSILDNLCYNSQIINLFSGSKNGLSLLCKLYIDDSKNNMGLFYRKQNCITLDDIVFNMKALYIDLNIPNKF